MKPSRLSLFWLVMTVLAVGAASQWWAGRQERRIGAQVAALVRPGDIRMLSSETCSVCVTARAWMRQNKVPFSECVIERDAACRIDFDATRSPGTPVLMVRGKAQIGFNPQRLHAALSQG